MLQANWNGLILYMLCVCVRASYAPKWDKYYTILIHLVTYKMLSASGFGLIKVPFFKCNSLLGSFISPVFSLSCSFSSFFSSSLPLSAPIIELGITLCLCTWPWNMVFSMRIFLIPINRERKNTHNQPNKKPPHFFPTHKTACGARAYDYYVCAQEWHYQFSSDCSRFFCCCYVHTVSRFARTVCVHISRNSIN